MPLSVALSHPNFSPEIPTRDDSVLAFYDGALFVCCVVPAYYNLVRILGTEYNVFVHLFRMAAAITTVSVRCAPRPPPPWFCTKSALKLIPGCVLVTRCDSVLGYHTCDKRVMTPHV